VEDVNHTPTAATAFSKQRNLCSVEATDVHGQTAKAWFTKKRTRRTKADVVAVRNVDVPVAGDPALVAVSLLSTEKAVGKSLCRTIEMVKSEKLCSTQVMSRYYAD